MWQVAICWYFPQTKLIIGVEYTFWRVIVHKNYPISIWQLQQQQQLFSILVHDKKLWNNGRRLTGLYIFNTRRTGKKRESYVNPRCSFN